MSDGRQDIPCQSNTFLKSGTELDSVSLRDSSVWRWFTPQSGAHVAYLVCCQTFLTSHLKYTHRKERGIEEEGYGGKKKKAV